MVEFCPQPILTPGGYGMRIRVEINFPVHADSPLKLVSEGFQLFALYRIGYEIALQKVLIGTGKVKMGEIIHPDKGTNALPW